MAENLRLTFKIEILADSGPFICPADKPTPNLDLAFNVGALKEHLFSRAEDKFRPTPYGVGSRLKKTTFYKRRRKIRKGSS